MNCIEFEELLEQCVEHRAAPDLTEVQAHTHHCAECAGRWEQFLLLESAVKVWNREVPEVDFTANLLEKLTAALLEQPVIPSRVVTTIAPRTPFRNGLRRLAPLLVPAALVALFLYLKPAPAPDAPLPPLTPITQTDTPPDPAPETPEPVPAPAVPQTDRLVKHAEQAYWQLGNELASAAGDFTVLLPTAETQDTPPVENTRPAAPAPWMDRLGNELNPLPGDVGRAFQFLKDAVPNSGSAPL